jgi:hypothetical protein
MTIGENELIASREYDVPQELGIGHGQPLIY